MVTDKCLNEVLLPISFRLQIERALWQSLLETHPEVARVRDAWAMRLPYLLEQASQAKTTGPQNLRHEDFTGAINAVTDMLNAAVTKQTVEGMKRKSFLRT